MVSSTTTTTTLRLGRAAGRAGGVGSGAGTGVSLGRDGWLGVVAGAYGAAEPVSSPRSGGRVGAWGLCRGDFRSRCAVVQGYELRRGRDCRSARVRGPVLNATEGVWSVARGPARHADSCRSEPDRGDRHPVMLAGVVGVLVVEFGLPAGGFALSCRPVGGLCCVGCQG